MQGLATALLTPCTTHPCTPHGSTAKGATKMGRGASESHPVTLAVHSFYGADTRGPSFESPLYAMRNVDSLSWLAAAVIQT